MCQSIRPGLQPFLDHMSKLYEMHVYTMGTRSYADAICKVIDPEGKIFGSRILSRDESGSELKLQSEADHRHERQKSDATVPD